MTTDTGEWFLRGHAAASILFNDKVWVEQTCQTDRGEYDPPLPTKAVDDLRDRQRRMSALEKLMVQQGRTDLPLAENSGAWVRPGALLALAGRPLDRHDIRWVPATLMREYRALYETPLPTSADQGARA